MQPTELPPIEAEQFLRADVYSPRPTLIRAARELFLRERPDRLWSSAANTDGAVEHILDIIKEARRTDTRRLVLLSGVPGSGKTLVGMRIAHEPGIDSVVFLSGNDPLVKVLQYVLREAGGGGSAFVRALREYVRRYAEKETLVPPEHVVVFDEAQRAFDKDRVADTHQHLKELRSEPELAVGFAERNPNWSVIVGLVGGGQEIHLGEEGGLTLWAKAIIGSREPRRWTVHVPPAAADSFRELDVKTSKVLSLNETLRSHRAPHLHAFVAMLLQKSPPPHSELLAIARQLEDDGHDLHITRDLELAKSYLRERYKDDPDARFGLMASSRDRDLTRYGVPNDFESTNRMPYGPWYIDGDADGNAMSCRRLQNCVTEFGAQGLELDAVLLAWGTDFVLREGRWTIDRARSYSNSGKKKSRVRDAWQLRANSYRVLLTRGRDAHLVMVPPNPLLDETWTYLCGCGFRPLIDPDQPPLAGPG